MTDFFYISVSVVLLVAENENVDWVSNDAVAVVCDRRQVVAERMKK